MENVKLVKITPQNLSSFGVYLSEDLHQYIYDEDNIAVGCVYGNYACGVCLAIYENDHNFHLLSLYIDEKVRGQGLGKYLLLGTMGMVESCCGDTLYICYSEDDLGGGDIHPVFKSVGFEGPFQNGVTYIVRWENLKDSKIFSSLKDDYKSNQEVIQFKSLNPEQMKSYREKIKNEQIPSYLGVRAAKGDIIHELTYASVRGNEVTGVFITTRIEDYVYINSVYTTEGKFSSFLPLIKTVFSKAKTVLKDDDFIKVTAVSDISKQLNDTIFKDISDKIEEEFLYEYYF